jgi:hypothetical protein
VFIADWSRFLYVIRTSASVEMSSVAGESFERHMVFAEVVIRLDTNCTSRDAFAVLTGCTEPSPSHDGCRPFPIVLMSFLQCCQ